MAQKAQLNMTYSIFSIIQQVGNEFGLTMVWFIDIWRKDNLLLIS